MRYSYKKYIRDVCFALIGFTLVSCGLGELKKSSNNRLFDATGFHKNKRKPLYNQKYISRAKKNIYNDDYDIEEDEEEDDYSDENIRPSARNLHMYKKMLKSDLSRKTSRRKRYNRDAYDEDYYSEYDDFDIPTAREKLSTRESVSSRDDLEREIREIKTLLKKTREEVTNAKCPYQEPSKKQDTSEKNKANGMSNKNNKGSPKDLESRLKDWLALSSPQKQAEPGQMSKIIE
ncbi:MAG: hypothetical protein SFT93_02000 [Rickettsiaceae bacterium]|nr:hypothetical protein [Rickettsiaceae bacterium]